MNATTDTATDDRRPLLLFVDDEQRVLNSMRIMFRKDYRLMLTTSGSEALDIVRSHPVDVVVSDQRMPRMTGVEVLTQVRSLSPRTVRILLTGYSDLDAIEGSINEGEVFRFLNKPCAPTELRETLRIAVEAAEAATPADAAEKGHARPGTDDPGTDDPGTDDPVTDDPVTDDPVTDDPVTDDPVTDDPVTDGPGAPEGATLRDYEDTASFAPAPSPATVADQTLGETIVLCGDEVAHLDDAGAADRAGVLLLSADEHTVATVRDALGTHFDVHAAGNVVHALRVLESHRPGVLVTDLSTDPETFRQMTAALKRKLPELVSVVVSEHRDVEAMVSLINEGQAFRFLRKPLTAGRCLVSVQAAMHKHRSLVDNPALLKRHRVAESTQAADTGLLDNLADKLSLIRRFWAGATRH